MRSSQDRAKYDYINKLFAKESEEQLAIRNQIINSGEKQIQIEAFEGKILSLLIQLTKSKKILEFGTMYGYSTSWLAAQIGHGGIVVTIEKDETRANIAQKNLVSFPNIKIINNDAKLVESEIEKYAPYDLIFIDANKSGYKDYFDMGDKFLKKGGLIIADNCMFNELLEQDMSRLANIIHDFNLYIANRPDFHSVIIPSAGGLLCAVKS